MVHPLETATLAAVKEHESLKAQIATLTKQLRDMERECDKKDGEIIDLTRQLSVACERSDHYLRWNVEITRQLSNINMFVQDAMHQARVEIDKPVTESEKLVKKLTSEFRKEAGVDLNELEQTILTGNSGKPVDKQAPAL